MTGFIEWTDKLTLGIQEMDEQHLGMFRVLERLAEAARLTTADASLVTDSEQGGEIQAEQYIHELLDELLQHTEEHFRCEEKLMAANRYPNLNEHRREHTMLKAELKLFVRDITKGTVSLDQKTLCSLKQWLIVHIRESDKAFADYVHESVIQ
jgi:hemerythrin